MRRGQPCGEHGSAVTTRSMSRWKRFSSRSAARQPNPPARIHGPENGWVRTGEALSAGTVRYPAPEPGRCAAKMALGDSLGS